MNSFILAQGYCSKYTLSLSGRQAFFLTQDLTMTQTEFPEGCRHMYLGEHMGHVKS